MLKDRPWFQSRKEHLTSRMFRLGPAEMIDLQFEVIQYRLLQEYGAACEFRSLPFYKACWLTSNNQAKLDDFLRFKQQNSAEDKDGHPVYLAQSEWFLNTEIANNPDIVFHFSSEVHK